MGLDSSNDKELISKLERALYYEAQYRNAIVSDAFTFYDINVTKDLIENDFYYRNAQGQPLSVLEHLGLSAPCTLSEFSKAFVEKMIPDSEVWKYPTFQDIRSKLLQNYDEYKRDFIFEYEVQFSSGKRVYMNNKFLLTKNEAGDICALSVVRDYSDIREKIEETHRKELEKYAYYDSVTNGYNYIKFKEVLRAKGSRGSIIAMDIHSFKVINSICGISKGDQTIREIWNAINSTINPIDGCLAAHVNADHFIIFAPTENQEDIIEKISSFTLLASEISGRLGIPQLRPYFGISKWEEGKRIELSYSEAVAAKHNAKNLTNINYAFFDEQDTIRLIKEKVIADSFEEALKKNEFIIWYQPKYNPVTKALVGAEALIRWQKDDGTIIPPIDFIPLFEKNGMIRTLDEYVFKKVCTQQQIWKNAGRKIIPISINLSRVSLYYKDLVKQYKKISDTIGIDRIYVPIEITESAAINNSEIQNIAEEFFQAGFLLQMDDFGSGYSSLSSLNVLHFETLKLDKSLIDYIGNFNGDRLIEHTICLAKELGIHVTAEGVENENQVQFLKHTGCDSIQGYFYSRPVPLEEFEKKLELLMSDTEDKNFDYVSEHIKSFKQSLLKPSLCTFVVNVSQDSITESSGDIEWLPLAEQDKSYSDSIKYIYNKYLLPEYKDEFISLFAKDSILSYYTGEEQ
nr:bifunctional diguanylate cyclase/phosphodiesterase [Treponemataceae bacterium]